MRLSLTPSTNGEMGAANNTGVSWADGLSWWNSCRWMDGRMREDRGVSFGQSDMEWSSHLVISVRAGKADDMDGLLDRWWMDG